MKTTRKLKIGDYIVMDRASNNRYSFTKGGSKGRIIAYGGNQRWEIAFSLTTGLPTPVTEFTVEEANILIAKSQIWREWYDKIQVLRRDESL